MAVISSEECYAVWAPDESIWAQWAKPVAFTRGPLIADRPVVVPSLDVAGLPGSFANAAIVVDLPGAEAVTVGVALASRGYRPVPLFNGTMGPRPVVDVEPIRDALGSLAATLRTMTLAPDARPAFLLDAKRTEPGPGAASEGYYDNRWVALPQDFPSAAFLSSRGIREVTLLQRGQTLPASDLAHVLRRWQENGIRIRAIDIATGRIEDPLDVPKPSRFRSAWYAAVAVLGFRRSDVGGFGSTIPEQTHGRGGGGFYG
jgi:hypothetical protein